MRILFAAAEALPYWKIGGLADVARSLPDTLAARGHDIHVILPFYPSIRDQHLPLEDAGDSVIRWPGGDRPVRFLRTRGGGAPALFVDQPEFFDTSYPYGAPGELAETAGWRFAFFSRVVAERARALDAEVVHLNDWPTGLVPIYGFLDGIPAATVLAIHNLPYQGNFTPGLLDAIGVPREFLRAENGVEFWGAASFMKGGLALADRLVTVSPTYAQEIQTPEGGAGLDGLLRFRHRLLHGILNGLDTRWNPLTDSALPERYDAENLHGKDAARAAVLAELGLQERGPLVVLVTRLVYQKGIDLLLEAIPWVMQHGGVLAVLGNGDRGYQQALMAAAEAYPGRVAYRPGFDDPLARRLYAGGDFFVMPSRYEPCGLGQMIAQRYGTPPVARRTGGLADTIRDGLTGYLFDEASPQALTGALERGFRAWRRRGWDTLRRRCMALDWSWEKSAVKYEEVYRMAIGAGKARATAAAT